MCGVVGAWHLDGRPVDPGALERMRDRLVHRGPDDAGLWTNGPVGLGHRRLAIIDLSEAGRMPMASPDGRVHAVFNGEVYNYRELRDELRALGHAFRSESDSEVVLRAYEAFGVGCFDRFNGMFAVAIWDDRERRLVLARDPAGQKPLYYSVRPGRRVVFASTLAPLIEYGGGDLGIDPSSVMDYVRFGFPFGHRSMLQDVRSVPPGCVVSVGADGSQSTHPYFDLVDVAERAVPRPRSEKEYIEEFRSLMREAVEARLVSDVPLGAFLSGGVDSSLVVALMAERDRASVKTFTIGFDDPTFDESADARAIAQHLGVQNTVQMLRGQDVLAQLGDVVRFFDEPMADYSVLPTLAVSKLARRHVTVALTGDGADEELGGYRYYVVQKMAERYMNAVPRAIRSAIGASSEWLPSGGARRMLARSTAPDAAHFFGLGGFYRGATAATVNRLLREDDVAPRRVADFLRSHPLGSTTEAGMLYDATHTLPGAWLYKVDRASMAVSLEARSPFLDRRVLDFCFTLPLEMRIRGRHKKHLVRQVLRDYLPTELIERPKRGFTAPVTEWLRGDLRAELEGRLSAATVCRRGFFDPAVVDTLVEEHLRGTHNHAQLLWGLLVLEWWIAHHLEGETIDPSRTALHG